MARQAVVVHGLKELRRDLRRIDKRLDAELRDDLRQAAQPVADAARAAAPRGTRPIPASRSPRKRLADTVTVNLRGGTVSIVARGPHARIVHEGGRRPLAGDRGGAWITVPARPFITDAIEAHQGDLIDSQADTVDRMLTRNGFR